MKSLVSITKYITRLQYIQNAASWLFSLTSKIKYVKPVLKRLHWLPVAYRIKYKIVVIMHRCVNGTSPVYLQSMLAPYVPRRNLRSSTNSAVTFVVPRVNQKTVDSRAFSTAGPRPQIWNKIPSSIRIILSNDVFRKKLKTHYSKCIF